MNEKFWELDEQSDSDRFWVEDAKDDVNEPTINKKTHSDLRRDRSANVMDVTELQKRLGVVMSLREYLLNGNLDGDDQARQPLTTSLTVSLKKFGETLQVEDKAAILSESRQYRRSGIKPNHAALHAIDNQIQALQSMQLAVLDSLGSLQNE